MVALFIHSGACVWGFVPAYIVSHTKYLLQGKIDDDDECGKYGYRSVKWGAYLFFVPTSIL